MQLSFLQSFLREWEAYVISHKQTQLFIKERISLSDNFFLFHLILLRNDMLIRKQTLLPVVGLTEAEATLPSSIFTKWKYLEGKKDLL